MYIGDIFTRKWTLYIYLTLVPQDKCNHARTLFWQCFLTVHNNSSFRARLYLRRSLDILLLCSVRAFVDDGGGADTFPRGHFSTSPPRTLWPTPDPVHGVIAGTQILDPLRLTRGHFPPRTLWSNQHSAPRDPRPRATHDPARTATHDQHDAEDEEQNAQAPLCFLWAPRPQK